LPIYRKHEYNMFFCGPMFSKKNRFLWWVIPWVMDNQPICSKASIRDTFFGRDRFVWIMATPKLCDLLQDSLLKRHTWSSAESRRKSQVRNSVINNQFMTYINDELRTRSIDDFNNRRYEATATAKAGRTVFPGC
jgi:hypothetical protein